jgi:hypothetical protein
MKKIGVLAVLVAFGATASPAFGQATRTWVSGTGDDANPCSRTAPCKTFAGAISKTAVDGIIDAQDDGGFGAVTITKSITIDGGSHTAGALASGGINAINVAIAEPPGAAGDTARRVILRNLNIEGNGTTLGLNGINISGAGLHTLELENVHIGDFSRAGLTLRSALSSPLSLSLDGVVIEGNADGVNLRPPAGTQVNALIRNTRILNNHFRGDAVNTSGAAVAADGGAHVWLTGDTLFGNDIGLNTLATNGGSGVFDSFCDNQMGGNTNNGTAPNELCPKPTPQTQVITNTVGIKQCTVPKLKGMTVSFARKLLSAAGCRLGKVSKKTTKKRSKVGKVMTQKTRSGTVMADGSKVAVTVGKKAKRGRRH